jgi:two-component system chemotaxis response regulator CheY
MRLFLCDDNAQYRELARLVLRQAGHEIVGEAGDGAEAIELAPQCAPDVVLLDLNMPNLDGFEALPRLRAALGPSTAILILTTGQAPRERERSLDGGADGFIVKPERIFALDDELRAALARAARPESP